MDCGQHLARESISWCHNGLYPSHKEHLTCTAAKLNSYHHLSWNYSYNLCTSALAQLIHRILLPSLVKILSYTHWHRTHSSMHRISGHLWPIKALWLPCLTYIIS